MPDVTITINTDEWAVVPRAPQGRQLEITAFNLCSQFGLEFVQAQEQFVRAAYEQMIRNAQQPEQAQQSDALIYLRECDYSNVFPCNPCCEDFGYCKTVKAGQKQPTPRPEFSEQLEIKTLSTQLHAVTELLRAREREITELKKPAPRPAFYVDKQSWLSCTHRVAPCEIPVWCRDADVVLKLMLALHDINTAPRPVPTGELSDTLIDSIVKAACHSDPVMRTGEYCLTIDEVRTIIEYGLKSPVPMGAWLPITTAPRDGTNIILYSSVRGVVEGCWEQVEGGGHPENGPAVYWWTSPHVEFIDGPYDAPTHWMPLIEPPTGLQRPAEVSDGN